MCSIDSNCVFNNPYKNNVDMKANEAPERIWINPSEDLQKLSGHIDVNSVEYTRTDAFIEKAKKWFEKYNEWFDLDGSRHCDMENFENFKKAMKL